jgi:Secretion system C-terminal sorting domain
MRKLIVLLLICSSAFAQNFWQNEITLNSIPSYCKINSCVSSKGIHIVYTHNGGVKYTLSSPNGSIIKQDKVIENEGAGCTLPNVVSINNEVYAIYVKNNKIYVAKSNDLGDTWSIDYTYYSLTNTNCNTLVTLLENDRVHMTWSENRTTWGTDVHYVCFYYNSSTKWDHYKRVTDIESAGGEMPAIALSQDRVHISYKTNSLFAKTRDMFKSDHSWQSSPQLITDVLPGTVLSYQSVFSINNQLHAVLRQDYIAGENPAYYIKHYLRSTDNVTWQQSANFLRTESSIPMISAKTQNNRIHIIYFDKNENNFIHRYLENDTWSSKINNVGFYYSPTLNVDGNDLYLTYNNDELTPSSVRMRRYDDSPLVPANFTLTPSQNWHPYLAWSLNTQADIQNYYLERSQKSIISGSQWTNWEILPAIANTQNYYEDLTISNASGAGPMLVRYRLRVKDYNNYSDYTNTLQMAYGTSAEKRIIQNNNTLNDYALMQCYPNPFNPSSNISYQLPEPGLVQLKVYNLLGKEVASLVNEFKPEGEYSINFNASGLPSGVYIYSLRVNGFVQNQKMTLMK